MLKGIKSKISVYCPKFKTNSEIVCYTTYQINKTIYRTSHKS